MVCRSGCTSVTRSNEVRSCPLRRGPGRVRRQAILLLGGDESGEWNNWYEWAVSLADDLYDE